MKPTKHVSLAIIDMEEATKGVGRKISIEIEMNTMLSDDYTKQEVEVALKQMAPLMSPELDGFNPRLY